MFLILDQTFVFLQASLLFSPGHFSPHSGSRNLLTPGILSINCVTFVRKLYTYKYLEEQGFSERECKREWEGNTIHSVAVKGSSLSYHNAE